MIVKISNIKSKIILGIIASAILYAIGYFYYSKKLNIKLDEQGVKTFAEIIELKVSKEKVQNRSILSGNTFNGYFTLKYKYLVSDKEYTARQNIRTTDFLNGLQINLRKGDSIQIIYLPDKPHRSKLLFNNK